MMKTFKKSTLLLLAGALAALAMNLPFEDAAPAAQMAGAPPPFSWNDIFKGPP
jgi:hypothetical protein